MVAVRDEDGQADFGKVRLFGGEGALGAVYEFRRGTLAAAAAAAAVAAVQAQKQLRQLPRVRRRVHGVEEVAGDYHGVDLEVQAQLQGLFQRREGVSEENAVLLAPEVGVGDHEDATVAGAFVWEVEVVHVKKNETASFAPLLSAPLPPPSCRAS